MDRDFYILGLPIRTPLGQCYFIKVKDYPIVLQYLSLLSLNKDKIINLLANNSERAGDFLQTHNLYGLVKGFNQLNDAYSFLFDMVFQKQGMFDLIDEKNFNFYRNLLMEMNCVREEKINPNPEIQKWIEKSRQVKNDGVNITFTALVSSVVGYNGLSYNDINEMTIYQLYTTFHRIVQIKNYETSTLFATVSSEKIKIESWFGHIDLFGEQSHGISKENFNRSISNVLRG